MIEARFAFDVEHQRNPGGFDELDELVESRHPMASAQIQVQQFLERGFCDGSVDSGGALERRIVHDDNFAVARHAQIRFNAIDAGRNGALVSFERVLGIVVDDSAAMRDDEHARMMSRRRPTRPPADTVARATPTATLL